MTVATVTPATLDDLYRVPDHGKAEIVNGELRLMGSTGDMPGCAGSAIDVSLRLYERQVPGRAYPDNVDFRVRLPNRQSFSPAVAFYTGKPTSMKFLAL